MILRPYQCDCLDATQVAFAECDRVLNVLPTGSGKTIIFSHLAAQRRSVGERTLILAHRDELIDQAVAKLEAATGIRAEKEKAEFSAALTSPVVVASVQTLLRRLEKWPKGHFGLVVCDEAHHALSESWQRVLSHFEAQVLGVTATPDRGDKKNLGQYFQTIGFEVSLFDLVAQGYLSPITMKSIPLTIDLSSVRSTAGDFNDADLGSALEPYLDQIAMSIKEVAGHRRTLAFLPLIATSRKFVAACKAAGISAQHVDGQSADRAECLDMFAAGYFDLLSNAMLLTEGYDVDSDPTGVGIDCIVVLRPTRSRPLYAQMVGRGTRTAVFKNNLLLLDFLWMHERHSIVRPANLIARDELEADLITKLALNPPATLSAELPLDLQELAGVAISQRETALRKRLKENASKKARTLSAEEFAMQHDSLAVAEYEPTMSWESEPVTEKQITYLKRAKLDLATVRGKGHASRLLSLYFGSKPIQAASSSQKRIMRLAGHVNWETATAGEARRFFAAR